MSHWLLTRLNPVTRKGGESARGRGGAPKRRAILAPREPIYVASQVAAIWGVDLKTIHGWVERGDIEAFRTPGRHLRFRRRALLHFLRRYDQAIPPSLSPMRPRVMVLDHDMSSAAALASELSSRFEVIVRTQLIAGLAEVGACSSGAQMLDAVVVALDEPGIDGERWVSAVMRHPDARYTRVLTLGGDAEEQRKWRERGAFATAPRDQIALVRGVIEKALHVGPPSMIPSSFPPPPDVR